MRLHLRRVQPAMARFECRVVNLARSVLVDQIRRHEIARLDAPCIAERKRRIAHGFPDRPPDIDESKAPREKPVGFAGHEIADAARCRCFRVIDMHARGGQPHAAQPIVFGRHAAAKRAVKNENARGSRAHLQQRFDFRVIDTRHFVRIEEVVHGAFVRLERKALALERGRPAGPRIFDRNRLRVIAHVGQDCARRNVLPHRPGS